MELIFRILPYNPQAACLQSEHVDTEKAFSAGS